MHAICLFCENLFILASGIFSRGISCCFCTHSILPTMGMLKRTQKSLVHFRAFLLPKLGPSASPTVCTTSLMPPVCLVNKGIQLSDIFSKRYILTIKIYNTTTSWSLILATCQLEVRTGERRQWEDHTLISNLYVYATQIGFFSLCFHCSSFYGLL